MFEHAAFADDVAYAFGADDLVFPDVLEGKGEAGVFPLDDADLSEGAAADDAQEAEVVEAHWKISQ